MIANQSNQKEDDKFLDQILARQENDKKQLEEDKKNFESKYPKINLFFNEWMPNEEFYAQRLVKLEGLTSVLLNTLDGFKQMINNIKQRDELQIKSIQVFVKRNISDIDSMAISQN